MSDLAPVGELQPSVLNRKGRGFGEKQNIWNSFIFLCTAAFGFPCCCCCCSADPSRSCDEGGGDRRRPRSHQPLLEFADSYRNHASDRALLARSVNFSAFLRGFRWLVFRPFPPIALPGGDLELESSRLARRDGRWDLCYLLEILET